MNYSCISAEWAPWPWHSASDWRSVTESPGQMTAVESRHRPAARRPSQARWRRLEGGNSAGPSANNGNSGPSDSQGASTNAGKPTGADDQNSRKRAATGGSPNTPRHDRSPQRTERDNTSTTDTDRDTEKSPTAQSSAPAPAASPLGTPQRAASEIPNSSSDTSHELQQAAPSSTSRPVSDANAVKRPEPDHATASAVPETAVTPVQAPSTTVDLVNAESLEAPQSVAPPEMAEAQPNVPLTMAPGQWNVYNNNPNATHPILVTGVHSSAVVRAMDAARS